MNSFVVKICTFLTQVNWCCCRIDANITETHSNVDAAHTELLKYFKGITSNRWLMMKIFAVVIIFFIIFIIFVA